MSARPSPIPFLKGLLWVVGAGVVLALILLLLFIFRQQPPREDSPPPASASSPVPPSTPAPGNAAREPTVPAPAAKPSANVQEEEPWEDKSVEALQQQTETAFWEGRFHEAVVLGLLCTHGTKKSAECRKFIGDAHAALNHKDQAAEAYRAYLSMTSDHEHSAEIQQVLERLEKAWQREKFSADAATGPILRPSIVRSAAVAKQQAREAFAEGLKFFKLKVLTDAAERAEDCLALEPNNVDCNLLAAASESSWEGEQHYRRFLRLSPNVGKHTKLQRALKKYYWSRMRD